MLHTDFVLEEIPRVVTPPVLIKHRRAVLDAVRYDEWFATNYSRICVQVLAPYHRQYCAEEVSAAAGEIRNSEHHQRPR